MIGIAGLPRNHDSHQQVRVHVRVAPLPVLGTELIVKDMGKRMQQATAERIRRPRRTAPACRRAPRFAAKSLSSSICAARPRPVALTPPDHAGLKRFTFFVSRRREEVVASAFACTWATSTPRKKPRSCSTSCVRSIRAPGPDSHPASACAPPPLRHTRLRHHAVAADAAAAQPDQRLSRARAHCGAARAIARAGSAGCTERRRTLASRCSAAPAVAATLVAPAVQAADAPAAAPVSVSPPTSVR